MSIDNKYLKSTTFINIKKHIVKNKHSFKDLMYLDLKLYFPDDILKVLSRHMINPMATTIRDVKLTEILMSYNDNNQEVIIATLNKKLENLKLQSNLLMSQIPNSWDKDYQTFNKLVKNEKLLRSKYRRSSDQFYSGVQDLLMILKGNQKFYSLENRLNNFKNKLLSNNNNKTLILNEIKKLMKKNFMGFSFLLIISMMFPEILKAENEKNLKFIS